MKTSKTVEAFLKPRRASPIEVKIPKKNKASTRTSRACCGQSCVLNIQLFNEYCYNVASPMPSVNVAIRPPVAQEFQPTYSHIRYFVLEILAT